MELSSKDPFEIFNLWIKEAEQSGHSHFTAAALATINSEGLPTNRFVLLKGVKDATFHFFTNYQSHKAGDLGGTPHAALTFFWEKLEKQVRIEGKTEKVSPQESDDYWKTRPRDSQIGAWASPQSSVLKSRDELEKRVSEFGKKFEGKEIPRPVHWGGYKIIPERIEFWIGQKSRLHDRFQFLKTAKGWTIERLAP